MCIKALAADVREDHSVQQMLEIPIDGVLMEGPRTLRGSNGRPPLRMRDALNKIIHGTPALIEVSRQEVRLHFTNRSDAEHWSEVWFSGTQLLKQLDTALFKHRTEGAEVRERQIETFLTSLGVGRFLPTLT